MLSYCLKYRQNTESKDPRVSKSKNKKIMLSSKCAVCNSKRSRFIKEKEASGLLSQLGIRILLSKIPLLGVCNNVYNNEQHNKFLLAGDKFMPEMHLRQPGFPDSVCGPLTKNKTRIQKFEATGNFRYTYRN